MTAAMVEVGVSPDRVFQVAQDIMLRPWNWAWDWHCLGDAADVFHMIWDVDPIPAGRGLVNSYRAARRIVGAAGGLQAFAEAQFRAAGLVPNSGAPGAIGIGPSGGRRLGGQVALICLGSGVWIGKMEQGLGIVRWAGRGWTWPT